MDTNARVRTQVAQLVASGIDTRTLARQLGVSPRWLRRWRLFGDRSINVAHLDRLHAYLADRQAVMVAMKAVRRSRFRLVSSRW